MIEEKNLSLKTILETDEEELNEWISKVGFHNKKAAYIKKATDKINTEFNGKVPGNFEDLCSLPGVGPKMAHLLL